ncbi:unnamed protein product [Prunus armeniaca]|uniref:Uncharacterized protein n=1 Tax=Prunus armeniaca TaxID=36596 RepID=A0A6J5UJM8_PRUAR|nr:unnamed protein product [Prunus armeniaca]
MRVDNEPFPAHMIGVNWLERCNKRKNVVDVGEEGPRKVTIVASEKLKATITTGRRETERHLSRMATRSYRPFSPREGPNKSYETFRKIDKRATDEDSPQRTFESTRLEERDKEAIGCSKPSTTSNSTNVRPPSSIKPALIQDGKWYLVGKRGKPGRELTNTQARRIKRQYGKAIRDMENQTAQSSPQRTQGHTRYESHNKGRSTIGMLRPKGSHVFTTQSKMTELRPFLENKKATEEKEHGLPYQSR